jgi:hypothetical protein
MHVPLKRFYGRNFPFLAATNKAKFVSLEMLAEVKDEDVIEPNARHLEAFLTLISHAAQCIIPFCMQHPTVKQIILEIPAFRNTIHDECRAKVDGIFSVPPVCNVHGLNCTIIRNLLYPGMIGTEEMASELVGEYIKSMDKKHLFSMDTMKPLTSSIDWSAFPTQIRLTVIFMQKDKYTPVDKFNRNLRNSYPFNDCKIFEIPGFGHIWDASKKLKEESIYRIANSLVLPSAGNIVPQKHNVAELISLNSRL